MIPRQKIRAYLSKIEGTSNPSSAAEVLRTIDKAYSGFVHGASPHIMDLYLGDPASFHTNGVLGTYRYNEHVDGFWDYIYRSYLSHQFVAKAFGSEKHVEILAKHRLRFEKNADKHWK